MWIEARVAMPRAYAIAVVAQSGDVGSLFWWQTPRLPRNLADRA
jgi:hypothetical protein